jgi:hypothetical protein
MMTIFAPFARAQQASPANPALEDIVSRMEQARMKSKASVAFQLTREYKMFHGDETKPASQVKAEISFLPPHERDYKIVESKGNDRGEKVVRKILDHEAAAEKSDVPPTAIVRQNYDFQLLGEESFQGNRCYILTLEPKRKDPALVEGRAWVDSNSFLIRKIEGKMSKSPSWWVKNVQLSVLFGEINGVWTQISSQATADVKVIGRYTVDSHATNLQTAESLAANIRPKKVPRPRRSGVPAEVVYNTGVLVVH